MSIYEITALLGADETERLKARLKRMQTPELVYDFMRLSHRTCVSKHDLQSCIRDWNGNIRYGIDSGLGYTRKEIAASCGKYPEKLARLEMYLMELRGRGVAEGEVFKGYHAYTGGENKFETTYYNTATADDDMMDAIRSFK